MKFGLKKSEMLFLKLHLIDRLKALNARVFIFGSRALGTQRKFSDLDVLYLEAHEKPIPLHEIHQIKSFMEESEFPYKIDLVNHHDLAPSYRTQVDKQKVEV